MKDFNKFGKDDFNTESIKSKGFAKFATMVKGWFGVSVRPVTDKEIAKKWTEITGEKPDVESKNDKK